MKANRILVALILTLMMVSALQGAAPFAVPVGAQGVVSLSIDDIDFAGFPEIKAFVTVRNENGVPILDLTPDKFEIVEDGRSSFPPSATTTQVNPDAVISVVLVIDISGSMKGKPIEEAMRAANTLLDQLGPDDRVAIVAFADEVNTDPTQLAEGRELGFTTDKNAARNVVNFLDTNIGWDTPLYDGIYKGVKMVSTEPVGKRAVIVMTDGIDERDNAQGVPVKDAGSQSAPDDPINEANRHNIPIFSVGLGNKIDAKYLGRLAERTGGVYQQAPEPEELTPLFENVLNQLKQQYTLTYNSTLPEDDNYHSLLVRVQLPQGQAYGETKFQFLSTSPPPAQDPTAETETPQSVSGSANPTVQVIGQVNPTSPPSIVPTPRPETSGVSGIVDKVRDVIEEKPLLAAVIGGGVLLLLLLLLILLIVVLRGRGSAEDSTLYGAGDQYAGAEFGDSYGPPPGWTEGATTPGTPAMGSAPGASVDGFTEVATSDWPGAGAPVPAPMSPPAMGPRAEIPVVGGTRIIERAPKHLAMLVHKSHPDQKFDLKGTTNVGRAQDNQVVLDDPTISRHHAWIKAEGEDFLVFDVGSANGTFVNDQRVEEPRRLENGDVVRFGEVDLVFTKIF